MTVDVKVCLWNATAPVEAARPLTHTPSSCCNQEHCELIMCYPQAVCIDTDLHKSLRPLGVWLCFYSKLAHYRTVYLRRSHYDSQRMRSWRSLRNFASSHYHCTECEEFKKVQSLLSVSCHLKQFKAPGLWVHETKPVIFVFPLKSPTVNIIDAIYLLHVPSFIMHGSLVLVIPRKQTIHQNVIMSPIPDISTFHNPIKCMLIVILHPKIKIKLLKCFSSSSHQRCRWVCLFVRTDS